MSAIPQDSIALHTRRVGTVILLTAVGSLLAMAAGCQSPTRISERYTRPAEINMAGRQNVVVEPIEGGNQSASMLTSRLKESLGNKGFNVMERGAWDVMRRERTLGGTEGNSVEGASVLIKGRIHEHVLDRSVDSSDFVVTENGGKKKGGREYTKTMYRTIGVARVETAFDVVDLETSKLLVSTTSRAERKAASQFGDSAPSLDESGMMRQCYEEVVSTFMQKLAPFSATATHNLLHVKDNAANETGIAYLQGGRPGDALEKFESALVAVRNNPAAKAGDAARVLHNRAVALEVSGKFDEAINAYQAAMGDAGGLNDADNISRCEERLGDQRKLKDQGVRTKDTGGSI